MPEVEIIRKAIMVVGEVSKNTYGDLTFKDKEGNDYKISAKRVQYFEKTIIPGMGVQLNYAMSSFGKEYIYSAELVKDKLPTPQPPPTPATKDDKEIHGASSPQVMTKDNWAEKDRITRKSIERQTSLNAAVKLAEVGIIKPDQVIPSAKLFEVYLEGNKEVA